MRLLDRFLPASLLESQDPISEIQKIKYRFVGMSLFLSGIFISLIFLLRLLTQIEFSWSIFPGFLVGLLCMSTIYWMKKLKKIVYIFYLFFPISAVVISFRLLSTGEFNSPIMIWCMLFGVFCVITANGKLASFAVSAILGLTAILAYVNDIHPIAKQVEASGELYSMMSLSLGTVMLAFIGALYAYLNTISENKIKTTSKDIEKLQNQLIVDKRLEVKRALAVTYNHEINNPLMIAKGAIRRYRSTQDPEQLKKALEMIQRMETVISSIKDNEKNNPELEDYTDKSQMIKLKSNKKVG